MEDISVQDLHQRLANGEVLHLIDVREPFEHDEFNIGGTLASLQSELPVKIQSMDGMQDEEIIVYCRSGNRSQMAKMMFEMAGFKKVRNLTGGMLAWKESFPSK
ncbi:MAG: rhodanese-like domain-containing protein [Saprospiraceae bacterium]|nr:rhodanese-like domain-containing protein [Saprospiraceae bacterium]